MSWLKLARDYWPRRAEGLPPGQREVRAFPRFSDEPLRWPPALTPPTLSISIEGQHKATIGPDDFARFQSDEYTHDFHCVTSWSYRGARWRGTPLRSVLEMVLEMVLETTETSISNLPSFARVAGADDRHAVFMIEDLLDPSVLLVTEFDGEPLDQRHGGPLRIVSPLQYGYKSVKHLNNIDFTAEQPASSFGKKEHLRARIASEERHSTLPNWLTRRLYRFVITPTALAAERAVRKSPR